MSAPHCFLHITDRYLKSVIPLSLSITLHESGIEGVKKTLHGSQIHMPRGKLYHLLTALLFTKNVHENNASIKEEWHNVYFSDSQKKTKQTQVFQHAHTHLKYY